MITMLPEIQCHILKQSSLEHVGETASRCDRDSAYLQKQLECIRSTDPIVEQLFSGVEAAGGKCVVFGGWARDQVLSKRLSKTLTPRDLDIVVDGISSAELKLLLPYDVQANIFGGFSASSSVHLDVWTLESTYLMRRLGLPVAFETLPATTVFRINSLAFGPEEFWGEPVILDAGFYEAIHKREVSFRSNVLPFPSIQAARAVIYSTKLKFALGPTVVDFIRDVCSDAVAMRQVREGLESFCSKEFRDEARIALDRLL